MLPLILIPAGIAAVGWTVGKFSDAGLTPLQSQTGTPGTLERNADKLGSAASTGLLLVSLAFAYSLVRR